MKTLARFIFWDFSRGSWQYDVMVALILGFIFLTPRDIFQDRPRAASVEILPGAEGMGLFWIAPELLEGVPAENRVDKASVLVNSRFKTRQTITHVEPILDGDKDITGYMAYGHP